MRLEKASIKAIKYACMNFHYAKAVPSVSHAFAVFNDENEWCGVICYSGGANNNIGKAFNLPQGRVIELVRVALNGKHGITTKAVAMSLKLLKKQCPLIDIVVSYADPEQGHIGTIYQAMNFIYAGTSQAQREVIDPRTGKIMHKRTANSIFGTIKGMQKSKVLWKHKYIFPLSKSGREIAQRHKKDYPKKQQNAAKAFMDDAPDDQSGEGSRY